MQGWLDKALDWLIDQIADLFEWVWEFLLKAVAAVLERIPVPDWLDNGGNLLGSIPPEMVYFLDMFEFQFGVTVFLSALGIRFLIRRIPIIG